MSVYCCLVVTCWERADLLALVGDHYCILVTFPFGILGQVCYLIVSFPDLCCLSYLKLNMHGANSYLECLNAFILKLAYLKSNVKNGIEF